jgi:site-specific DNA recombinase
MAATDEPEPSPNDHRIISLLADYDQKLAQYRRALDTGADPAVVTGWFNETQTEKARLERELRAQGAVTGASGATTAAEIDELINSIGDVTAALSTGALDDKATLYKELGLSLTYHPDTASVYARAELAKPRWAADCVGGGT